MQNANLWIQQSKEGKKDATLIKLRLYMAQQFYCKKVTLLLANIKILIIIIIRILHFLLENSSEVYINFFVRPS